MAKGFGVESIYTMIDIQEYITSQFPGKHFNSAGNLHANCPFHDDTTKSFSINSKGMFICGSTKCGVRGNFAYFYKLTENITWKQVQDALKIVAPKDNLDMATLFDRETPEQAQVTNEWPANTEPLGDLEYFEHRGFNAQEVDDLGTKFGLRYGVDGFCAGVDIAGTIVVPVYDLQGIYRTFQVRYLDPNKGSRWKNPLNSPLQDLLYGGWRVSSSEDVIWVVEGASDTWNLARFGHTAVALFTKEATCAQMMALHAMGTQIDMHYIVCLDGDAHSQHKAYGSDYCAGLNSELRAFGLRSSIIYLDAHEDPGGLSEQRVQDLYEGATR